MDVLVDTIRMRASTSPFSLPSGWSGSILIFPLLQVLGLVLLMMFGHMGDWFVRMGFSCIIWSSHHCWWWNHHLLYHSPQWWQIAYVYTVQYQSVRCTVKGWGISWWNSVWSTTYWQDLQSNRTTASTRMVSYLTIVTLSSSNSLVLETFPKMRSLWRSILKLGRTFTSFKPIGEWPVATHPGLLTSRRSKVCSSWGW